MLINRLDVKLFDVMDHNACLCLKRCLSIWYVDERCDVLISMSCM